MIHTLHIGLSYGCNMHCNHCFVAKKTDRLTTPDIESLIDALVVRGLFIVYYTYGEPLLARNFVDICNHVKSRGLVQVLMTNGSLIDGNTVHTIKMCGIQNVFVSLDSIVPEEHDSNRGYPGAFDKALCSIRECRKQGIPVGIATTVRASNITQLDDIYQLGINEDVSIISFLRQRINGRLLPLTDEQESRYRESIYKMITATNGIGVNVHDPALLPWLTQLYSDRRIPKSTYEKYYEMCSCHSKTTMSVAPDGTVSACNLSCLPVGNVIENQIDSLIQQIDNGQSFICCTPISESCQ